MSGLLMVHCDTFSPIDASLQKPRGLNTPQLWPCNSGTNPNGKLDILKSAYLKNSWDPGIKTLLATVIVRYLVFSGEDCFDHKIDYFENGIGQPLQAANPSDCQEKCQKNADCSFWTFLSGKSCLLKTSDGGAKRNNLAISGPKNCPSKFKKF